MRQTDSLDLESLGISAGEARKLELGVAFNNIEIGAQRYSVLPQLVPLALEVSRTVGGGYTLRLRFTARIAGPCMRCLGPAEPAFGIDVREAFRPGGGEGLESPYVSESGELDLKAWGQDSLLLALPVGLHCSEECRGLCPQCGINLNDQPTHCHQAAPDPRWSKLSELRLD